MQKYRLTPRRVMQALKTLGLTREQIIEAARKADQNEVTLNDRDIKAIHQQLHEYGRCAAYVTTCGKVAFVGGEQVRAKWPYTARGGARTGVRNERKSSPAPKTCGPTRKDSIVMYLSDKRADAGAISRDTGTKLQTVHNIMSDLLKDGMARRVGKDGRKTIWALTPTRSKQKFAVTIPPARLYNPPAPTMVHEPVLNGR